MGRRRKKEHLTRAVIEGIAFSLLQILKIIEKLTTSIKKERRGLRNQGFISTRCFSTKKELFL